MDFESKGSDSAIYAASGSHLKTSVGNGRLFNTLSTARSITSHFDFYHWLQTEIREYIPHEVLLLAWGDFEKGDLQFDAASSLTGVDTRYFCGLPLLESLLLDVFKSQRDCSSEWKVLQDFNYPHSKPIDNETSILNLVGERAKSALLYSMTDERDGSSSLYIFFSIRERIGNDPLTLEFLMPYIDAAMRRVECMSRVPATSEIRRGESTVGMLSDRECEVMNWVGKGKTNREIGAILGISHNTVKNHLKRVFNKMGVTARSQAVQVYVNGKIAQAAGVR